MGGQTYKKLRTLVDEQAKKQDALFKENEELRSRLETIQQKAEARFNRLVELHRQQRALKEKREALVASVEDAKVKVKELQTKMIAEATQIDSIDQGLTAITGEMNEMFDYSPTKEPGKPKPTNGDSRFKRPKDGTFQAKVLTAAEQGPATWQEIVERVGLKQDQVLNCLSWLRIKGLVSKSREGIWSVVTQA